MLTKSDLFEIEKVVKRQVEPLKVGQKKIEKKFDELFNFLDRKYIEVKKDIRNIQGHLRLPLSDF